MLAGLLSSMLLTQKLSSCDLIVNVVGGLTLTEPATDLAVAVAVASSRFDTKVAADTVVMGELGEALDDAWVALTALLARQSTASFHAGCAHHCSPCKRSCQGLTQACPGLVCVIAVKARCWSEPLTSTVNRAVLLLVDAAARAPGQAAVSHARLCGVFSRLIHMRCCTGLGGELRAVPHAEKRVMEAAKLGYKRAVVPAVCGIKQSERMKGIQILACRTIADALNAVLGEGFDGQDAGRHADADFEEGGY